MCRHCGKKWFAEEHKKDIWKRFYNHEDLCWKRRPRKERGGSLNSQTTNDVKKEVGQIQSQSTKKNSKFSQSRKYDVEI